MASLPWLLVLTMLICATYAEQDETKSPVDDVPNELPGHMQPIGSHMEPRLVERIRHMPTPQEFNEEYVLKSKPVIFEGLMSQRDVIKNWQSDDYLRMKFGDNMMGAEAGKKENRSHYSMEMKMSDFLDDYKDSDIYMVSDLSVPMYEEWEIPRFMLCGGYTEHLALTFLWFSSGGTKSVLHSDTNENLHCLISGTKKFVMFKPHFAEIIGSEHYDLGFYHIDVEKVNMTAYPNLAKIPWYLATVNSGDCLYLPYVWLHHVESTGRNMGVNVWWSQFQFQPESCPSDLNDLPQFAPLANFEFETVVKVKKMLEMAQREDGTVHASDLLTKELRMEGIKLYHMEELIDVMQPRANGVLKNIHKLSKEAIRKGTMFFVDLFLLSVDPEENLQPLSEDELREEENSNELESNERSDDTTPTTDQALNNDNILEDINRDEL